FDADAALEHVGPHEDALHQAASETVHLLHSEHVVLEHIVERLAEPRTLVHGQLAADLLLEHSHAIGVQGIVLPCGLLLFGTHSYHFNQFHGRSSILVTCSFAIGDATYR